MLPEEQRDYVEIICVSFTETEIEQLEIYAHHCFGWIEAGKPFQLSSALILERLQEYEEGSEDE